MARSPNEIYLRSVTITSIKSLFPSDTSQIETGPCVKIARNGDSEVSFFQLVRGSTNCFLYIPEASSRPWQFRIAKIFIVSWRIVDSE